ncbi:MAG TPA: hypothetical protein VGM31_14185 [Puia sp.]|jgi:hypothetical protein
MIWLPQLILILLTIAIAYWHSRLIKSGRPIKHGLWAFVAGVLIAGATWWVWPDLSDLQLVLYATAQGCARLVVFNVSLNLFRGLSWKYVSTTTTSVIDQLEGRLFGGRVWISEIMLTIIFIILQFFI